MSGSNKIMNLPTIDDLIDNFSFIDDWEERYKYIIDLGRHLPPMDDAVKTNETIVRGCTSRVWMIADKDDQGRFQVVADSDAHIVKGLIAILLSAYNGKTANDIANMDIEEKFRQLGLDQHLSPNRRNGFFAMVERVKSFG